jgi:4-amino-4-deoxy-L-arabinose transferase-like glycosyltransferase
MKLKIESTQNRQYFLWFILGLLLVAVFFWSLNKEFDHDELEVIHTSWKILKGEELYVDFFQHHHPLLYYLLVPVIAILGEKTSTLIAIRLIFYACYAGILFATYLIAKRVFQKTTAILSLVLLVAFLMYTRNAIEIRPDVPQTLLGLLSIYWLFVYLESKSHYDLFLCSLSVGLSFLFLQKSGIFILLEFIILLLAVCKNQISYRSLLFYLLGSSLPFGFYLLYLYGNGYIDQYFTLNWLLNFKFIDRNYPWSTLLESFRDNLLSWTFFLIGLCCCLSGREQKRLGIITIGVLLFIITTKKSHQQYLIPLFPLIAILAAEAIHYLRPYKKVFFCIVFLSIFYPSLIYFNGAFQLSNHQQLRKIDYVMNITPQNERVYDGDILFNVFRSDIDFFWYSLDSQDGLDTYKSFNSYHYNIYESIEKFKPKVISTYYIPSLEDSRIKNFYTASPVYADLFIRQDNL